MKTRLKDKLKKVQDTFNIIEKQLVTPRYLQLIVKGSEDAETKNFAIGTKVKLRTDKEIKVQEDIKGASQNRRFLVTGIDKENKKITIETLSATENDPFILELMDDKMQVVYLKCKCNNGERAVKDKHGIHNHKHHGKHKRHHESLLEDKTYSHHQMKHHASKKKQHSQHEAVSYRRHSKIKHPHFN